MEAGDAHSRVSSFLQEAVNAMEGDTLHLSSGCRLCKVCAKVTGDPCRHPGKALAAVEGYGIDVYRTVQDTPLKYTNGANTVTYFGIILFSE